MTKTPPPEKIRSFVTSTVGSANNIRSNHRPRPLPGIVDDTGIDEATTTISSPSPKNTVITQEQRQQRRQERLQRRRQRKKEKVSFLGRNKNPGAIHVPRPNISGARQRQGQLNEEQPSISTSGVNEKPAAGASKKPQYTQPMNSMNEVGQREGTIVQTKTTWLDKSRARLNMAHGDDHADRTEKVSFHDPHPNTQVGAIRVPGPNISAASRSSSGETLKDSSSTLTMTKSLFKSEKESSQMSQLMIVAELAPTREDLRDEIQQEMQEEMEAQIQREVNERLRAQQMVITEAVQVLPSSFEDQHGHDNKSNNIPKMFGISRRLRFIIIVFCILALGLSLGLGLALQYRGHDRKSSTTESTTTTVTNSPKFLQLLETIGPKVSRNSIVFSDVSTPQYRAMEWLANNDAYTTMNDTTTNSSSTSFAITIDDQQQYIERYALAVLYFAMNGPSSWNSIFMSNFSHSGKSVCKWNEESLVDTESGLISNRVGAYCNTDKQYVTELMLDQAGLAGYLPTEIALLGSLTKLTLEQNKIEGSIPTEMYDMTRLKYLSLKSNELGGEISSAVGNLEHLEYLDLNQNQLEGSIPSEVGLLKGLKRFDVGNNKMNGTLPTDFWSDMTSLTHLYMCYNKLSLGIIPTEIGVYTNLSVLGMMFGNLTGTIPTELGLLTNLTTLHLAHNSLSGSIPSELGNLVKLKVLYLGQNQLHGTVPVQLDALLNLNMVTLSDNELTGSVDNIFCVDSPKGPILSADCDVLTCTCCTCCDNNCNLDGNT